MERRGTRTQYQRHPIQDSCNGEQIGFFGFNSERWIRYVQRASDKSVVFTTPFNLLDEDTLMDGFRLLDGKKARGIDGISKRDFREELESNIKTLTRDLKSGKYRPMPRKEVMIPKSNGKLRPIAIACFKDKVVEAVTAKILNFIYEPLFVPNSFGFRPRRSAHGAINASYKILKDNKLPWVVEIDFASFFNTVPHKELFNIIQQRINDARLLGLLEKFAKAKIVSLGKETRPTVGTPQGSVVSPILSNIYLHYVLDEWFVTNYASKNAQMVRYADDAIFMFATKDQAESFIEDLVKRTSHYKLRLNLEKTKLVDFTEGHHQTFSFLGFTFLWGRKRGKKSSALRVKTQKEKLFKKSEEIKEWVKSQRSRMKVSALLKITASKLRGHYNYFGYKCNRTKLVHFTWLVQQHLYKWLNRRSQKKSYNWSQFQMLVSKLPKPPEMYLLKPLGVTNVRL